MEKTVYGDSHPSMHIKVRCILRALSTWDRAGTFVSHERTGRRHGNHLALSPNPILLPVPFMLNGTIFWNWQAGNSSNRSQDAKRSSSGW